jgi:hypothetical protein
LAVTGHVYTKQLLALGSKLENYTSDTFKILLLSAYTPAVDTHEFVSDVLGAGTEASGTGYVAGGQSLASVTFTASGHVYTFTAGTNPSWNASGGSLAAAYAVLADTSPGSNATNPVLAYWDFGGTQTATNSTFQLTISGSGLLTLTGTG